MGGCVSVQLSCDQAFTQACGCFFGDGNYIHMMESNLEVLEKSMQQLKEKRDDLLRRVYIEEDKGLQRLAQVQGWLTRVQDIESQVNDLLKTKSTESQRLCLFGYCSNKCKSSCKYGKKVSEKLKEVKELLKEVFDILAEKAPVPKVGKQHIQTIVGLDSMVEKAWNSLKNPKGTTLGLYGMGGVGKTTLLACINNKFIEDVNESDVVIWVVVSKDLHIEGIQNQILGRLRLDKEWKQESEEEKRASIYNILSRKKCVLLFDDLWSEVDLNKIGVPPRTRENGLKIAFTTRSKEVCRAMKADEEMKVDCLSSEEAWELFQKIVGENTLNCHEDIPTLARKIVGKCCGLPLVLTVIGKAMACKEDVHEWQHTLNVLSTSSHEFPGMEEKILSIMKFSYDGLENEDVKSCFLYCALFPEDYEIEKRKLIEYWMCEGLINGNIDEDGSSSQGHAIIGSLVRAHLLLDVDHESIESVKMHDVLREMALWITSDFVKSGGQLRNMPNNIEWEVVRRISLMSNRIAKISCCPHNCPNLSTLLLSNNSLEDIPGEFFRFMSALVVLDLSKNRSLRRLPEEISTLSSLKYLNLSFTWIKVLPVGLKGLNKLISLDLENTLELKSVDGIGTSLPNLQVLKLYQSGVYIDARLMEELQLFEHLEILTANIKDAFILERIQGVKRLANSIRFLRLRNMLKLVVVLNTTALSGLQRLDIMECEIYEIKIDWERIKEREELLYTNSLGFKHLSAVYIHDLEGPKDLTWLLFAQNLKVLKVLGSQSIEEIINFEKEMRIRNMSQHNNVPFAKLESLGLYGLLELRRITSSPPGLPNLKKFVIEGCPSLSEAARSCPNSPAIARVCWKLLKAPQNRGKIPSPSRPRNKYFGRKVSTLKFASSPIMEGRSPNYPEIPRHKQE